MIIGMRSPTFETLYIACLRKSCIRKSRESLPQIFKKLVQTQLQQL